MQRSKNWTSDRNSHGYKQPCFASPNKKNMNFSFGVKKEKLPSQRNEKWESINHMNKEKLERES